MCAYFRKKRLLQENTIYTFIICLLHCVDVVRFFRDVPILSITFVGFWCNARINIQYRISTQPKNKWKRKMHFSDVSNGCKTTLYTYILYIILKTIYTYTYSSFVCAPRKKVCIHSSNNSIFPFCCFYFRLCNTHNSDLCVSYWFDKICSFFAVIVRSFRSVPSFVMFFFVCLKLIL